MNATQEVCESEDTAIICVGCDACTLIGMNPVSVQGFCSWLAVGWCWHRGVAVHCDWWRQSRNGCSCDGGWSAGTCRWFQSNSINFYFIGPRNTVPPPQKKKVWTLLSINNNRMQWFASLIKHLQWNIQNISFLNWENHFKKICFEFNGSNLTKQVQQKDGEVSCTKNKHFTTG